MYNGVINIYKEAGFTSHDVVAKLRGILKQKKIGHTGTLDPDAVGVLPVCLGRGTKLCDMFTEKDKVYVAKLLLGKSTDTQDISGTVIEERSIDGITHEQVIDVINSFVGEYNQLPPMYSALKVDGRRLYDIARAGGEVHRELRKVTIYSIEIIDIKLPVITMKVHCSKGTYIRTLCNDIGEKLGCLGCMQALERSRVSNFEINDSLTLSQVQEAVENNIIFDYIIPIDKIFEDYNRFDDDGSRDKLLINGNMFRADEPIINGKIRVYRSNKDFVGIYEYNEAKGFYVPVKIFFDAGN